MIVLHAGSGTGNQLFQFAAARALGHRTGLPIMVDVASFGKQDTTAGTVGLRRFVLGQLQLPICVVGAASSWWQSIRGASRIRTGWMKLGRSHYECPGTWQPEFDALDGGAYLTGYFQDRRYFEASADSIVGELSHALSQLARREQVLQPESDGALHVRRGDYLLHPQTDSNWFEQYYDLAMTRLLASGCRSVSVFSDDPDWCRIRFAEFPGVVIQPADERYGGLLDLWRISQHRFIAICNSTFSWWAARLSPDQSRIVAPVRWTAWCPDPERALMLPGWQRIGTP